MKAWQFVGPGQPLTLNEVPEPVAGPGEIGVDILAAGLCHSDVGYLEGTIPADYLGELPRTLGHEVAGRIAQVGDGVEGLQVGDLVALVMGFDGPGVARDGEMTDEVGLDASGNAPRGRIRRDHCQPTRRGSQ